MFKNLIKKLFSFIFISFIVSMILIDELPHVLALESTDTLPSENISYNSKYSTILNSWSDIPDAQDVLNVYTPINFIQDNLTLLPQEESYGYKSEVVEMAKDSYIEFVVNVEKTALYNINIDYYDLSDSILPQQGSVLINNEYQYYETRQLIFPMNWKPATKEFNVDRYKNELLPISEKVDTWQNTDLIDGSFMTSQSLKFKLDEGENTISIYSNTGNLLIGDIKITSPLTHIDYETYIAQYKDESKIKSLNKIEVEYMDYKSDPSVRLYSDTDPNTSRYDTRKKLLNAIDQTSWTKGGQSVTWNIDVEETGLYKIAFKYMQYALADMPAYRSIKIDNEIPFKELENYPFHYAKNWTNETLHHKDDDYFFYLTAGTHHLTMTVTLDPYRPIINEIDRVMDEISLLSLNIKKITGNKIDKYQDWKITEFIPDVTNRLNQWADDLEIQYKYGNTLNNSKKASGELLNLKLAIKKLRDLAKDPNELPNRLSELSEGSSSAAQLLGDQMLRLIKQPLGLEKMYIYHDEDLDNPRANFFVRIWESIKRFFISFIPEGYSSSKKSSDDEIEIWVNRPRRYVELMQKMIDEEFTPKFGTKVKLSIMPDENKLVLANAAGTQPDIAMGVSNWLPYDLAIRGASLDLRQFEGYEELVSHFKKGAMIPYVFEDGVYAVPETQDFWVTFYRTDIFNELNIPVPSTWQDVVDILPELQRQGMNFYEPLSLYTGLKPFNVTMPFIYQFGGDLYANDGLTTTLDSENNVKAIKFMTDLFKIYDVPKQVPNFYNHFRYGDIPIGIANTATYIQLTIAAPEIKGNWAIAPHPGVEDESGVVQRYAPVGGQSIVAFERSNYQQESFNFIKWWMSTETQEDFAFNLQTMFGEDYLWISANVDAFDSLPIPEEDKQVILEQWEWAMEASRVPGAYMVERELSNVWSKVVFNGANVRTTIDEAVITSNRELQRKMEEFGYVKNGVKINDYVIPTIYNIDYWLTERGKDE